MGGNENQAQTLWKKFEHVAETWCAKIGADSVKACKEESHDFLHYMTVLDCVKTKAVTAFGKAFLDFTVKAAAAVTNWLVGLFGQQNLQLPEEELLDWSYDCGSTALW